MTSSAPVALAVQNAFSRASIRAWAGALQDIQIQCTERLQ
jgi:hypothetical protein